MNNSRSQILALDLEGTLISNAISQIPRPGLCLFLSQCRELFPRIVIFTTVGEPRFRPIAQLLVAEKHAPAWFADIEYITWYGKTKDLRWISGAAVSDVILVDDLDTYVHPGQEAQYVRAAYFDYASAEADTGLTDVMCLLKSRTGVYCN